MTNSQLDPSSVIARFRAGVEGKDIDAVLATFSPDIRFFSPVKFTPFEGIDVVGALFRVLLRTFEEFRYVGELSGPAEADDDAPAVDSHILVFRTRVNGKSVHGIDLVQPGGDGLIETFTVMIRPMSAVQIVSDAIFAGLVTDGVLPSPATSD